MRHMGSLVRKMGGEMEPWTRVEVGLGVVIFGVTGGVMAHSLVGERTRNIHDINAFHQSESRLCGPKASWPRLRCWRPATDRNFATKAHLAQ